MIEKNFGGVRIDGTNATIIGDGDGNFIADRNGIARVWMDHALWPQMTTKLYIDQTGDINILNRTPRQKEALESTLCGMPDRAAFCAQKTMIFMQGPYWNTFSSSS